MSFWLYLKCYIPLEFVLPALLARFAGELRPDDKLLFCGSPPSSSHEEVEEPDSSSVDRLGGWSTL